MKPVVQAVMSDRINPSKASFFFDDHNPMREYAMPKTERPVATTKRQLGGDRKNGNVKNHDIHPSRNAKLAIVFPRFARRVAIRGEVCVALLIGNGSKFNNHIITLRKRSDAPTAEMR